LTQFQIFNVPPQGGSFAYSPLAAISPKSRHSSTRFCAGLHDRYPIVSYTNGKLWARRSPWWTPLLVFLAFSNRISVFCKKCISCISLWKMGRQSAKKAPNACPDTSTEASGQCLDIFPLNPGRSAQKNVQNWLRSEKICVFWAQNWPRRPPKSFLFNTVNTKKLPYGHTIEVVHKVLDFGPQIIILGSKSAFLAPKMHILADFWQVGPKLSCLLTRGHSTVACHITHFQKSRDDRVAHSVLEFLVFSNCISAFCKTCISCIFFLETGPPIGQNSTPVQ